MKLFKNIFFECHTDVWVFNHGKPAESPNIYFHLLLLGTSPVFEVYGGQAISHNNPHFSYSQTCLEQLVKRLSKNDLLAGGWLMYRDNFTVKRTFGIKKSIKSR